MPSGGVADCTTPQHKTHSTDAGDDGVVVYGWHPWAGRAVRLRERNASLLHLNPSIQRLQLRVRLRAHGHGIGERLGDGSHVITD